MTMLRCSKGRGVAEDWAEAAIWFGKAANQGLAEAQYRWVRRPCARAALHRLIDASLRSLGVMFDKGKGVPADDGLALKW